MPWSWFPSKVALSFVKLTRTIPNTENKTKHKQNKNMPNYIAWCDARNTQQTGGNGHYLERYKPNLDTLKTADEQVLCIASSDSNTM